MGAQQVRITEGPTNWAHINLTCPRRRSIAKERNDGGSEESMSHLMRP